MTKNHALIKAYLVKQQGPDAQDANRNAKHPDWYRHGKPRFYRGKYSGPGRRITNH